MNDIDDLFSQVAQSAAQSPSPAVVDADIARGRLALAQERRRRRSRGAAGGAAAVAAAAAVAVLVAGRHGSAPARGAAARHPAATTAAAPTATAPSPKVLPVQLVAYTGKQLAGFTVDRVPTGWHLSASTQSALTIDPQGDTDNDPDAFEGKLTVLLQSQSVSGLPHGQTVTVDGQPGVVTDDGGQALTYEDGHGHTVVIQAPDQLAWSAAQIVSFAEGVHVTGSAVAGVG